jgi:hypothetical protein
MTAGPVIIEIESDPSDRSNGNYEGEESIESSEVDQNKQQSPESYKSNPFINWGVADQDYKYVADR